MTDFRELLRKSKPTTLPASTEDEPPTPSPRSPTDMNTQTARKLATEATCQANEIAEATARTLGAETGLKVKGYVVLIAIACLIVPNALIILRLLNMVEHQPSAASSQSGKVQSFYDAVVNEREYLCNLQTDYAKANCDLLNRLTQKYEQP